MKKNLSITLLDDDRNFLQIMSMALQDFFEVSAFHEVADSLDFLRTHTVDAVLLDLHLRNSSGFEMCEKIKTLYPELPVIFLSGDTTVSSIQEGFERGAIDYLLKSTPLNELVVRIRQRVRALKGSDRSHLSFGNLNLDLKSQRISVSGLEVSFSPKEHEILGVFFERPNHLYTKDDLMNLLWKDVYVDPNNIDTHMFHLRKKLKNSVYKIQTIKGRGYIFKVS
jgi:DNA-binding response OmpR family regulator